MKPDKFSPLRLSLLACLLGLLTACSGDEAESLFAPDPKLKESAEKINSPSATPPNKTQAKLPDNFPQEIPRYREAQLIKSESTGEQGKTRWASSDPSNLVESYYQKEFQSNNWEIVKPFSQEADDADKTLVARRDNLQVTILVFPGSAVSQNSGRSTEFVIQYQRDKNIVPLETEESNQTPITSESALDFSDLDRVPQQLHRYVEDLAALGVLTSNQSDSQIKKKFEPNKTITRRDYVRWLVAANNKLYAHLPGKHIRLGSKTAQPIFQDVGKNDPDFAVIQGLAEAGLIPSQLTGDSTALLFRPDAPLTRENFILWKVPLDIRKALPSASIDAVKETWGFQDAAKIDPKALRSLFADFQNGEQSNVRRVFGYTILFQPKKPVTRAEAAAALWYFGYQGEGISAEEALQLKVTGD
ncbi:MAG: S-layer homology domain-containing protein [Xenococcaceae cyanobacterium]